MLRRYKVNTENKSRCLGCELWWPSSFVQQMFIDSGYAPVCAICADEIMGGLQGEISTFILENQQEYLAGAGRMVMAKQYFNNLITETQKGSKHMITPIVRFSYANVFEPRKTPSGDMKYSVACLLPKEDTKGHQEITNAIQKAVDAGLSKNVFAKPHVRQLRLPIRDGDEEKDDEGKPKYKGFWFINANSSNRPGLIDKSLKPLMSKDEFYSGCWGRADVNFFPYNQAGNRGVGVGLNNLMKEKDDDRLDGRQAAEDAFSKYGDTDAGVDTAPEGDDMT